MENKKISALNRLWLLAVITTILGIWAFMPNSMQQGYTVYAGCTMTGKATYIDGVPTCDCTSVQEATCSCVVPCPKKPGDEFEPEQGGTN
jgi:hypothetical protein